MGDKQPRGNVPRSGAPCRAAWRIQRLVSRDLAGALLAHLADFWLRWRLMPKAAPEPPDNRRRMFFELTVPLDVSHALCGSLSI